jgi:hypothetical protein
MWRDAIYRQAKNGVAGKNLQDNYYNSPANRSYYPSFVLRRQYPWSGNISDIGNISPIIRKAREMKYTTEDLKNANDDNHPLWWIRQLTKEKLAQIAEKLSLNISKR